jgi:lipopolysaccharide export system protein LptA
MVARAQTSAPATLGRDVKPSPATTATAAPDKPAKKEKSDTKKTNPLVPGLEQPKGPITTEIYADQASFDSTKYVGVFSGRVIVNDPRFNVQADKLTVFLHKGGGEKKADGEKKANGDKDSDKNDDEGLEKAIAEGNVGVVRDRPDPNGGPPQRAIGRADKAVYTTSDGNVVLTGTPRVQQGLNSHVATSADTVMVLNQSGELQTRGPSRTELRQEPKPSASPAAQTSPQPAASATPQVTAKP